jgi:hypothetical protein
MSVNVSGVAFFTTFYTEMARATFQTRPAAEIEPEPVPVSDPEPVWPISEPMIELKLVPQPRVWPIYEPMPDQALVISLDAWRHPHAA